MNRYLAFTLLLALALPLFSVGVLADHDDHGYDRYDNHVNNHAYPYHGSIHSTGYYYESYSHGWSGWEWNRAYYRYHAPYHTTHVIAPHIYGPPSPYAWYW